MLVGAGDGAAAPVVKDVGAKGVSAIAAEVKAAAEGAAAGTLTTGAYAAGTFTVVR